MRKLVLLPLAMALFAAGALVYVSATKPEHRPPSTETIAVTPELLARGEYLVERVLSCYDCHGDRQQHLFTMPIVLAAKGSGTACLEHMLGFPGRICPPNITP